MVNDCSKRIAIWAIGVYMNLDARRVLCISGHKALHSAHKNLTKARRSCIKDSVKDASTGRQNIGKEARVMGYHGSCAEDFDDWKGYEVSVSCLACRFQKTEYAQYPETIDQLLGWLEGQHRATGCTQKPRVFDALAEGIAAQEERETRGL